MALITFLTELTSNTATTTALVPVFSALALGVGINPADLIIPVVMAASCAFMLPVATTPNLIVYGSEKITISEMIRSGIYINLIGIILITAITQLIFRL